MVPLVPLVALGALEGAAEGIDDGMSDGIVEVGSPDGAADGPEVGVEVGPALWLSSGCAPGVVLTGSNAAHPLLASTSRLIANVVLVDEQAEYTKV